MGDFDGDGATDDAEFVVIVSGEVSCADGGVVADLQSQELAVRFASGQTIDRPFPSTECNGGSCADVFEATDLDGDGRQELAIDVGPGSAVAFMEFFRVEPSALHPLMIAEPGDPPYLEPGSAMIGGGFDATQHSPVACRVNVDGTRKIVSIHASLIGDAISGPWQIHTSVLLLRGDRLVVTTSSDAEDHSPIGGPLFENDCP